MTEQLSHDIYILASYGVTALVVAGLFGWLVITGRQRRTRIDVLNVKPDEPSHER